MLNTKTTAYNQWQGINFSREKLSQQHISISLNSIPNVSPTIPQHTIFMHSTHHLISLLLLLLLLFSLFQMWNVVRLLSSNCFCVNVHIKLPTQFEIISFHGNVVAMPLHTLVTFPASLTVFSVTICRTLIYLYSWNGMGIVKMKWVYILFAHTNMQFYAVSILIISFQIQLARKKTNISVEKREAKNAFVSRT